MLEPGNRIPAVPVWLETRAGSVTLGEAIAGPGCALLCFYIFDWSPG